MNETSTISERVRDALAERYARPIIIDLEDGRVAVLGGRALEVAHSGLDAADHDRVVALDVTSLPWFVVPADGMTLWRQHGQYGADGEVVTVLVAGDPPVQRVVRDEDSGWELIRCADGAQGWVKRESLASADSEAAAEALHPRTVSVEAFIREAHNLLGAPYIWGGTTAAGIDCSGLVQRAVWNASGWWLPRHSRALLHIGRRVSPSGVERGDVLVLKRDPSTYDAEQRAQLEAGGGGVGPTGPAIHPMHVAVAVSSDEVIHASRDAMQVVSEPLASIRERYRVLGVRRIATAGGASAEGVS